MKNKRNKGEKPRKKESRKIREKNKLSKMNNNGLYLRLLLLWLLSFTEKNNLADLLQHLVVSVEFIASIDTNSRKKKNKKQKCQLDRGISLLSN